MPNERLVKAINTPSTAVLNELKKRGQVIDLNGKKVQALFLGKGGFGKAYLYKTNNEYRVAKVYHSEEIGYGDIQRRVASFNSVYNSLYGEQLSSLATATASAFTGKQIILDMPYIGGIEYFNEKDRQEVHRNKVGELRQYFTNYGFFVSDFEQPGNIICFSDPKSNLKYILIRDVDVMGRKDSYQQNGENSVTYSILKALDDSDLEKDLTEYDFLNVLNNEEKTAPALKEDFEYHYLKSLLLQKMTPGHAKYDALNKAINFQELCFIAAQKRKKHIFSTDEGFTDVLDKLHSLLKTERENIKTIFSYSGLPSEFTKYDLEEVGLYGKLHVQGENIKLREKNLNYIYSVPHFTEAFKEQVKSLRHYSIFTVDLSTLPAEVTPPTDATPSVPQKPPEKM